jgi:hypothetical protein
MKLCYNRYVSINLIIEADEFIILGYAKADIPSRLPAGRFDNVLRIYPRDESF